MHLNILADSVLSMHQWRDRLSEEDQGGVPLQFIQSARDRSGHLHIFPGGDSPLIGMNINMEGKVGTGAVINTVLFQRHHPFTQSVGNGYAFGCCPQAFLHQPGGDPAMLSFHLAIRISKKFEGLFVLHHDPGVLQHFQ